MKARETQRKATAAGRSRKLKLSKETLQDLTPGKQRDIKGGASELLSCGLGKSRSLGNGGSGGYAGG